MGMDSFNENFQLMKFQLAVAIKLTWMSLF